MARTHVDRSRAKRSSAVAGPFDLDDEASYRRWRDWKLDGYPRSAAELVVEVADPRRPSAAERAAIIERLGKTNMALYAARRPSECDKRTVRELAAGFGLVRLDANLCAGEDGITSLTVADGGRRSRYIPYTDRPIGWHTDGYYNGVERQVRALMLHCVSDAAEGGGNAFLDHEVAYILLRETDPAHVAALSRPDVMAIPANHEDGVEVHGVRSGPVFSVDPGDGSLHMRYTARGRNVRWRRDRRTGRALKALEDLLAGESRFVFRHRLEPGQGVVSNNVLHAREGFTDSPTGGKRRLVYRARYFDRVEGTGTNRAWPGRENGGA